MVMSVIARSPKDDEAIQKSERAALMVWTAPDGIAVPE
jgi:hypothetical protein